MKHKKRLTCLRPTQLHSTPPMRVLAAALLGLGITLASLPANAKSHQPPAPRAVTAKAVVAKAGAKAGARAGVKAGKPSRSAIPVITKPAPPVAQLASLVEPTIQTGCLMLPMAAGAEAPLGVSAQQLQTLLATAAVDAANAEAASRCAPFVAVSLPGQSSGAEAAAQPGARPPAAALALLPTDDQHALVATGLQAADAPEPYWQDLDAGLPAVREVWLQASAARAAGLDMSEAVPSYLMHELGLLVKHMRKQSGAGENAIVRVLVQGETADDDEDASLAAVELVDPATGRALDSAVWVARDDEPGAYISSRGVEYERMLWQAPVDFRRISRGVGASSMLVHKRVLVQLKARKGKKPRTKVVVRAFQYKSQHIGIDYAAATGTPVVAVAEGEIVFSGWRGGYGNLVIVQHGSELTTYYGHLSAFSSGLQEGLKVRRGQEIGLVGSTGFSTGPHLHFEIRSGAKYMDPSNPAQKLPVWTMAPQEHETVLTRLLQLEVTRAESFMRTAWAQQPQQGAGQ